MKGRRVGYPRWVDHAYPLVFLAKPCQHRQQQAKFPATGRIIDQFCDRTQWPATAWQGRVEHGMTGTECRYAMRDLPAAPEQWMRG